MKQRASERAWRALALCLVAVTCRPKGPDADARTRLITALRDSVGAAVNPDVGFITDGGHRESHLYVTFDTSAAPALSDPLFDGRARDLARFALRHYERVSDLDSVTVATRQLRQPGVWQVQHRRTFAVAGLKEPGAP